MAELTTAIHGFEVEVLLLRHHRPDEVRHCDSNLVRLFASMQDRSNVVSTTVTTPEMYTFGRLP